MFWGLIVQPNKKYSQTVSKPFHVTHAVLDTSSPSTGDNGIHLVLTNEGVSYIICILNKSGAVQVPLNIYFSEGDDIAFLAAGGVVHLTGYLPDDFDDYGASDEEIEEEEVPELELIQNSKGKKSQKGKKSTKTPVEEDENSSEDEEVADSDDIEGEEEADSDDDVDDEEDEQEEEEEESDIEEERPSKKQKLGNGVLANGSTKDKGQNKSKKRRKVA